MITHLNETGQMANFFNPFSENSPEDTPRQARRNVFQLGADQNKTLSSIALFFFADTLKSYYTQKRLTNTRTINFLFYQFRQRTFYKCNDFMILAQHLVQTSLQVHICSARPGKTC